MTLRIQFLTVGMLLLLATSAQGQPNYAFVTATDFSSGCASWIAGGSKTPSACVENISSDAIARWAFGKVYVVNRFGFDNIQILDPGNGFLTQFQFSVGNGTNPQDIAVVSPTKAYVSRLGSADLLIVNPTNGSTLGTISLAAYADADGLPEAHRMIIHGGRVFLSLQRLFNFAPTDTAYVAVIDVAADTLIDVDPNQAGTQAILLNGANPNTDLVHDSVANLILVGQTGAFGVPDGGVEAIDPITLEALKFETTEAQLGGDINDIALTSSGRAYAVVSDASFNTKLVRWDRTDGSLANTLYNPGGFNIADIEIDATDDLWLCDRTFAAPGIRIFNTATDTQTGGLIDVGLPPFDIAFDSIETVAVGDQPPGPGASLQFVSTGPNPIQDELVLSFRVTGDVAEEIRLRVFDVRGAEIGRVDAGPLADGTHLIRWTPAAATSAGVYFYRLERGQDSLRGRLTLLR